MEAKFSGSITLDCDYKSSIPRVLEGKNEPRSVGRAGDHLCPFLLDTVLQDRGVFVTQQHVLSEYSSWTGVIPRVVFSLLGSTFSPPEKQGVNSVFTTVGISAA